MYAKCFKRMLDFILSVIAFIILIPFFIVIAIAIKIDSKGPVFFLQDRLGKDGKVFKIIKFRTMVVNAEKTGLRINGKNDNRITKLGNVLRNTSLDELPQLLNVIKGEMSIIGPRPPVTYHPYKYEDYSEEQRKRFKIRPGITGLAQTRVRNNATWDERIKIDVEYVESISFSKDIKIIVDTIIKTLKKENIYIDESNKDKTVEKEKVNV